MLGAKTYSQSSKTCSKLKKCKHEMITITNSFEVHWHYCEIRKTISSSMHAEQVSFSWMTTDLNRDFSADNLYWACVSWYNFLTTMKPNSSKFKEEMFVWKRIRLLSALRQEHARSRASKCAEPTHEELNVESKLENISWARTLFQSSSLSHLCLLCLLRVLVMIKLLLLTIAGFALLCFHK